MVTLVTPSQRPGTESCVVNRQRALRSVDRETIGQNASERSIAPKSIGWKSPTLLLKGEGNKAEHAKASDRNGFRGCTAGMSSTDFMGTREIHRVPAERVGLDKPVK